MYHSLIYFINKSHTFQVKKIKKSRKQCTFRNIRTERDAVGSYKHTANTVETPYGALCQQGDPVRYINTGAPINININ